MLLLPFGCCESCCSKQGHAHLSGILFSLPLEIYLEVRLLDGRAFLFLVFRGTSIFPQMSVPVHIPTSSAQGLQFIHVFANTSSFLSYLLLPLLLPVRLSSLPFGPPNGCKVIFHYSFDLHFSNGK